MLQAMRSRDRLVLYGERRQGKSSVIARAAERVVSEGGVVVSADAWTAESLDALGGDFLAGVPAKWLTGARVQGLLQSLRGLVVLSVSEAGRPTLSLSGGAGGSPRPEERFRGILTGLDTAAADHDSPVVVVIDEFQKIEELHEGGGAVLRGIVQDTPHLAWVFSGSVVGLVTELMGPEGPFHAIDRLEIDGIAPGHLLPWLEHRLDSHGVRPSEGMAEAIYDRAGPVTEYIMRLAKVVHRRGLATGAADVADVEAAFHEVVADFDGSFELIWSALSTTKRQIMRAVAAGERQLTAKRVLDAFGLASSAAASYAVNELRSDGILAPGKPFRISDPFLSSWVARQG